MIYQYKDITSKHLNQISVKLNQKFGYHDLFYERGKKEYCILIRIEGAEFLAYFDYNDKLTEIYPR